MMMPMWICCFGISLYLTLGYASGDSHSKQDRRKNVLLIIADDFRPQVGFLHGTKDFPDPTAPKPITPNLDNLASKSLVLRRAYVQYSLCGPSRASFLTGRRPDTTKIYSNKWYERTAKRNFTTIPQYFKDHGYQTFGMGKVFHGTAPIPDILSWSGGFYGTIRVKETTDTWWAVSETVHNLTKLHDDILTDLAVETLKNISRKPKKQNDPFMMIVGYWKPHLKFVCPKQFYDLYPMEEITLPQYQFFPESRPIYEWFTCNGMNSRQLKKKLSFRTKLEDPVVRSLRRAYYACVSYVDHMIGILLDKLEELNLHRDTVVSFIGDHGWFLGEYNQWCKHTNMELATHAPMLLHIPGVTDKGIQTRNLVEFVDLFPTLAEAAGLPPLPLCPPCNAAHPYCLNTCREGSSFMPLIDNPKSKTWKKYAFSQYQNKGMMGYAVRSHRYRYVAWFEKKKTNTEESSIAELYDLKYDPGEINNVAHLAKYVKVKEKLSKVLKRGWRKVQKP